MTGRINGVIAKLKTICPIIASVHCIAHRLQLALVHASHSVDYLDEFQGVVNSIYKYYHCSAKRLSTLRKIQEVFDLAHRKFKEVFDVRWLSFRGAVDAILCNLEPLIHALNEDKQQPGNATAQGLLKFVLTFDFLATVHMMSDVLGHLSRLSRLFQSRNIDFFHANLCFDACLTALKEMKCKPGPILQQFLNTLPQTEAELPPNASSFVWNGIEIQFNRRHNLDGFNRMMGKFLQQLCDNLENRFPDADALKAFSILNPKSMPVTNPTDSKEWTSSGIDSVDLLGKQIEEVYAKFPQETPPVTVNGLQCEWVEIKNMMRKSFSSLSTVDFIQKFVSLDSTVHQTSCASVSEQMELGLASAYPNFVALVKLYLCIPISSVDCERGFSTYNNIKTSVRNRLNVSTVNTLMQMSVDTPSITSMEEFNFDKAFQHWCGMKARRTHQLLVSD